MNANVGEVIGISGNKRFILKSDKVYEVGMCKECQYNVEYLKSGTCIGCIQTKVDKKRGYIDRRPCAFAIRDLLGEKFTVWITEQEIRFIEELFGVSLK